jgi:hypothetical protein
MCFFKKAIVRLNTDFSQKQWKQKSPFFKTAEGKYQHARGLCPVKLILKNEG